jgi:hypothetical protein
VRGRSANGLIGHQVGALALEVSYSEADMRNLPSASSLWGFHPALSGPWLGLGPLATFGLGRPGLGRRRRPGMIPLRLCLGQGSEATWLRWHDRRPKCRRLARQPALVAQRIEHLTTDQKVGGSSPSECTTISAGQGHHLRCERVALTLARSLVPHKLSRVLGDTVDLGQCRTALLQVVVTGL